MSQVLLLLLMGAPDPELLRQTHLDARLGTRIEGDSIRPFSGTSLAGKTVSFSKLRFLARCVVFLEPIGSKEGAARLAWWKKNHKTFTQAGVNVLLVASDPQGLKLDLGDLRIISDPKGFLAATFGVLRERRTGWGAEPLAFLLDDTGVIRLVKRAASAAAQGPDLLSGGKRLRRQLLEVGGP